MINTMHYEMHLYLYFNNELRFFLIERSSELSSTHFKTSLSFVQSFKLKFPFRKNQDDNILSRLRRFLLTKVISTYRFSR
jgi:hypothetical protein